MVKVKLMLLGGIRMLLFKHIYLLKMFLLSIIICLFLSTSAIAMVQENFQKTTRNVAYDNTKRISFIVKTIKDNIDTNLYKSKLREKIKKMSSKDLCILYALCSKSTQINSGPGSDIAFAMISAFLIIV